MTVVDANVLLYAVNSEAPHHRAAVTELGRLLNGDASVGFSWIVLLAFVRISTRAGIFDRPLSTEEALETIRAWLEQPSACLIEPTAEHLSVLGRLLRDLGTGGNLTSDAHLAALAIEHGGEVLTFDNDFSRFKGVKWRTPK